MTTKATRTIQISYPSAVRRVATQKAKATTAARRSHFTTSSQTGVLKLAASAGGIGSCAVVRGGVARLIRCPRW